MANEKTKKNPNIFCCEHCDFNTCNKKDYTRHLLTDKHKRLTNTNEKPHFTQTFSCKCGKTYLHVSSLSKHKKSCVEPLEHSDFDNPEN